MKKGRTTRGAAHRIAVTSEVDDARAREILRTLESIFPEARLDGVSTTTSYTVDAKLSAKELALAGERLTNPTTEAFSASVVLCPENYRYAIEIGYLPGVTDNVGHTAQETIEDCIGRKFKEGEAVYSSLFIFLIGEVSKREAQQFARELHNPLIEHSSIYGTGAKAFPIVVPKVELHQKITVDEINLAVSDRGLMKISKEGIKDRGPLALSLDEMKAIRSYFKGQKRNPTDVELEALAQTWSEHCKHNIFADPLDEVSEGIYKRYIKGATAEVRKQKGKKDFCVSVFKDNSGAIVFDDKYLITHKVETHNSPSGLDPYGGAVTAVVGVNRDCLGFGLGAKPIANTYGFCVADPNDTRALYRDKQKKQPLLPARRILEGLIRGIGVGGNQSGIPTPLGFLALDPSYRGKPLVFGGTVGLIPRKVLDRKMYEKKARPGDYIVMIGGRVGADGIHGATFSSEALSKGSPATAVQIGDPITQKKFSDALIREARDLGLYNSITDNGAGGLSGSVGEMAREAGGSEVELEKVPLKYSGLAPWQIWISESQERMTLAVPQTKWAKFKKIMDRHDVEATRIGTFTKSGRCVVRFKGKKVMEVSLQFLHDGRPVQIQKSRKPKYSGLRKSGGLTKSYHTIDDALLAILARPSVGSISFISEQYDHEVQGTSVTKPLQGKGRVNADAVVIKPRPDSRRGVVLAQGNLLWYSALDAYAMAAASVDTAVRNAVCAGASLEHLALLDNFCWSSSEKPERLYELKQAAKACYDTAVAYGTPFISGKDSMFNDFRGFTNEGKPIHIAALPTLLISAIGVVPDMEKAMTVDFKSVGDSLYLLGETHDELGASEYFEMSGLTKSRHGEVPRVNPRKNAKAYNAVAAAIEKGLVASAIGLGRGGLAIALAKSAIAGQLGVRCDLTGLPGSAKSAASVLFSESQGRMLISIRKGREEELEKELQGRSFARVGEVGGSSISMRIASDSFQLPLSELTDAYRSFFKQW